MKAKDNDWQPRYNGRLFHPSEGSVEDKFRALMFIIALLAAATIATIVIHWGDDRKPDQPAEVAK